MTKFLPNDEQRSYDSMVDGLRRAGWTRSEAEAEAIGRIDERRHREKSAQTRK